MIAKIAIPWMPSLLVNQAYKNNDMKKGRTPACSMAMQMIIMMMRPEVGYNWRWNGKRVCVKITLWNYASADPDGLTKSIDDALEIALRVDDKYFDTNAIGGKDDGECRIEIELSY